MRSFIVSHCRIDRVLSHCRGGGSLDTKGWQRGRTIDINDGQQKEENGIANNDGQQKKEENVVHGSKRRQ
jgi:hypothetical protein